MISETNKIRNNLLTIYQNTLQSIAGEQLVYKYLLGKFPEQKITIIAIGKAASSMTEGALNALGGRFCSAIVVSKSAHISRKLHAHPAIECIESGHPIPNEKSLWAADRIIEILQNVDPSQQLLFLISGGASALVEKLPQQISLLELVKLNQWLLASGLDIHHCNYIRKKLSLIKGGRLAGFIRGNLVEVLLISDVPDDRLDTIGSGLMVSTDKVANQYELVESLPTWVRTLVHKPLDVTEIEFKYFKNIHTHILTSNKKALKAAASCAGQYRWKVTVLHEFISGDTLQQAKKLALWLIDQPVGIYIWGAETSMQLPENPGIGGRNQSFALAMAVHIKHQHHLHILVAGTDGTDGNTDDAGAIIDGRSIERGEQQGVSAEECLRNADAGSFLAVSGDLVSTGPTGSNVMDIIIAIKSS